MYKKEHITTDEMAKVLLYMKESFSEQRLFLNNTEQIPEISEVLAKWPYLFNTRVVYQHFQQLMNVNPVNLKTNFDEKSDFKIMLVFT